MTDRPRTSLVALATFLVHAVGGCCAHHAHASVGPARNVAAHSGEAASPGVADSFRSPALVASVGRTPTDDGKPQPCGDEPACAFDVPAKISPAISGLSAASGTFAATSASAAFCSLPGARGLRCPSGGRAADELRSLLQTWLL